jgi:multiple antibiotic resistance protein
MESFWKVVVLFVIVLNPFLLSVYLSNLVDEYSNRAFVSAVVKASLISLAVFSIFSFTGEKFFRDILQVRYGSFLVLGGLIFLIISLQYLLQGAKALTLLRGDPKTVEAAIAMPFMIGPGTISVAVLAGSRLETHWLGVLAIAVGLVITVLFLLVMKAILNFVKTRDEVVVQRYYDIVGRFSSLVIGTISVDMIIRGVEDIMENWGT